MGKYNTVSIIMLAHRNKAKQVSTVKTYHTLLPSKPMQSQRTHTKDVSLNSCQEFIEAEIQKFKCLQLIVVRRQNRTIL